MPQDLSTMTGAELLALAHKRIREEQEVEEQRADARTAMVVSFLIDDHHRGLNLLLPDHDRTSCNDRNLANAGRGRCRRCVVLAGGPDHYLDLEVTLRERT